MFYIQNCKKKKETVHGERLRTPYAGTENEIAFFSSVDLRVEKRLNVYICKTFYRLRLDVSAQCAIPQPVLAGLHHFASENTSQAFNRSFNDRYMTLQKTRITFAEWGKTEPVVSRVALLTDRSMAAL